MGAGAGGDRIMEIADASQPVASGEILAHSQMASYMVRSGSHDLARCQDP